MLETFVRLIALTTAAVLLGTSHLPAGVSPAADLKTPILESTSQEAEEARWGKILFNSRLRYEFAEQQGLEDSHALTLRTRLGYETPSLGGFTLLAELENVFILGDEEGYNQGGLNNPEKTVIADPESGLELNRLQLAWTADFAEIIVGRQRIALDDERFIGDVGWRQNQQTFDAATAEFSPVEELTLYYGYLHQVLRPLGQDHPDGSWNSDSHVIRAVYEPSKALSLVGFAYLLRLEDAPALSGDTYGFRASGKTPVADLQGAKPLNFTYAFSAALQTDNRETPEEEGGFLAEYLRADVGLAQGAWSVTGTYERLGSDDDHAFQTPLATLHKFNGWADAFLITPANGLQDFMLNAGYEIAGKAPVTLQAHRYLSAEGGDDLGWEVGASVGYKFTRNITGLIKYAHYEEGSEAIATRDKFWAQVEVVF